MYAARKIRDTFRANKTIRDFAEIDRQMATGKENLELIRRQVSEWHVPVLSAVSGSDVESICVPHNPPAGSLSPSSLFL